MITSLIELARLVQPKKLSNSLNAISKIEKIEGRNTFLFTFSVIKVLTNPFENRPLFSVLMEALSHQLQYDLIPFFRNLHLFIPIAY